MKESRSLLDLYNETKSDCTFEDFPIGTKVKVVVPWVDHYFFYGETGEVIENSGSYLGIRVQFDKPRQFEGGYIQRDFNFNPEDLQLLDLVELSVKALSSPSFQGILNIAKEQGAKLVPEGRNGVESESED